MPRCLIQDLIAGGLTVILVTHESDLCRFLHRTLVLRDGRLIQDRRNDRLESASEARKAFDVHNVSLSEEAVLAAEP
jgi:putative ABC transport system ATP-binding protein